MNSCWQKSRYFNFDSINHKRDLYRLNCDLQRPLNWPFSSTRSCYDKLLEFSCHLMSWFIFQIQQHIRCYLLRSYSTFGDLCDLRKIYFKYFVLWNTLYKIIIFMLPCFQTVAKYVRSDLFDLSEVTGQSDLNETTDFDSVWDIKRSFPYGRTS